MLTKNCVSTAFQDEHNESQRAHLLACSAVFEAPLDGLYQLTLERLVPANSGTIISSAWVVDEESLTPYTDAGSVYMTGGSNPNTQVFRLVMGQKLYLQAFSTDGSGAVGLSGARLADEVPPEE